MRGTDDAVGAAETPLNKGGVELPRYKGAAEIEGTLLRPLLPQLSS